MPHGTRLQYKSDGDRDNVYCVVETSTIHSLVARGALESIRGTDSVASLGYRTTAKASELCG